MLWPAAAALADHEDKLLLDVAQKKVRAFNIVSRTLAGKRIRLNDLRGKVVFLNFWATWCLPCREEMPSMEKLKNKLVGRPFRMLAVNVMEPEVMVKKFVEDMGLTFTIVMDPKGTITENYSATNLPVTYIIDKKGYVVRRAIGAREWDGSASLHLFEKLLTE